MNDCFQSVSDGKSLVASAITDKGIITASDATFEIMANNISNIPNKDVQINTVYKVLSAGNSFVFTTDWSVYKKIVISIYNPSSIYALTYLSQDGTKAVITTPSMWGSSDSTSYSISGNDVTIKNANNSYGLHYTVSACNF